jgi:hypothetical protein
MVGRLGFGFQCFLSKLAFHKFAEMPIDCTAAAVGETEEVSVAIQHHPKASCVRGTENSMESYIRNFKPAAIPKRGIIL